MSDDRTLTKTEAGPTKDGGGDVWAWATEHGAPERASTEQLLGWLARGELPPYTLVWKPGWGEWLPAMQVAELAAAFPSVTPGSRRVARAAWELSDAPPPVPVEHYPRLRLLARDVVGHSTLPAFTSASYGVAPAPAERRVLRDRDYVQKDLVTSQVPVAAMLEAARAMKRVLVPAGERGEGRLAPNANSERSQRLDFGTFGDTYNALPPLLPGSPEAETGTIPLLRTLSPHAVELSQPALLEQELSEHALRPSRRYGRWLFLGALAGAALGLLAIRGPSQQAHAPAVPAAATAVAALQPMESPVVTGACRPSSQAVRLDEHASRDVSPVATLLERGVKVAAAPGVEVAAGWVAVAYAQTNEVAAGLALSPESLAFDSLGARRMARQIFSVTPLLEDGALSIHADRGGGAVAYARTLNVDPPLRIGMSALGLVAGSLEGEPRKIWELAPGTEMSAPVVATHAGGLTIASLIGRKQGPVRVGVLSSHGEPLSALGQLGDGAARFGRPALASGGGTTALAVAQRSSDGARQSLWLSRAAEGEPPLILQPFESTSDEPLGGGHALDTPAIAALPGGSFALLFTRGSVSRRRVQLQRLSEELAPLGDPVDVTPPEQAYRGASPAALHWVKDGLLAFHFLAGPADASLWVTRIECELGSSGGASR